MRKELSLRTAPWSFGVFLIGMLGFFILLALIDGRAALAVLIVFVVLSGIAAMLYVVSAFGLRRPVGSRFQTSLYFFMPVRHPWSELSIADVHEEWVSLAGNSKAA